MGIYLNPDNDRYQMMLNTDTFVDKSMLIKYTNDLFATEKRFICVSRPRRFGKSVNLNMLSAYYSKGCDSREMFGSLKLAQTSEWDKHLNKYNVIHINMQRFLSNSNSMDELLALLRRSLIKDFKRAYKHYEDIDFDCGLSFCMEDIFAEEKIPFVILIDEWDCVFREHRNDMDAQKKYLDFIRDWLKDQSYVALAYMTGILPIKKYGTHSALNMFTEYSMTNSGKMAEFTGFSENEVAELCERYHKDINEMRYWYNGYQVDESIHLYCPRSVVAAIDMGRYDNYWTRTETYEALSKYIAMDMDGLQEAAERLLAGQRVKIDINTFQNDMTTFTSADDVMTLLVHLGYLGYDIDRGEVFIPNNEVRREYVTATKHGEEWSVISHTLKASDALLAAVFEKDATAVAAGVERAHLETSQIQYNDENALSYTLSLAFYSARRIYNIVRELPAGKGFVDLAFLPRPQHTEKPALVIELKWDRTAQTAIRQIREKEYAGALAGYAGEVLLVGVSYDKKTRQHEAVIEEWRQ